MFMLDNYFSTHSPPLLSIALHHHLVYHLRSVSPVSTTTPPSPRGEEILVLLTNSFTVIGSEPKNNSRTLLSNASTNHRSQLFDFSGERRSKLDLTQRDKPSPISPFTVQNRCCMFLRMQNSLTVKLAPLKPLSNRVKLQDPLMENPLLKVHALSTGKHQPSHFPITGQSPTFDESPTGAAAPRRKLGLERCLVMGLGLVFSSWVWIYKSIVDLNYSNILQSRPISLDVTHGSRASLLMPVNNPLLSTRVGFKSDYPILFRVTGLGIQVKILYGSSHELYEAPEIDNGIVENDARTLKSAVARKHKSDDQTLIQIFTDRSRTHLVAVRSTYRSMYGKELGKAIRDETRGNFEHVLLTILQCAENSSFYFAKALRKSMKGLGTDDTALIRIVVTRAEVDMQYIISEYRKRYKKSLHSAVHSDTTGSYRTFLISLLGPNV